MARLAGSGPTLLEDLPHLLPRYDHKGAWSVGIERQPHVVPDSDADRVAQFLRHRDLILRGDPSWAMRLGIHQRSVGKFLPCVHGSKRGGVQRPLL